MKAVPLTKVEELIERLAPFMDQLVQLDELTLQRHKRAVRDNMHAYPWAGFIALGMIAVLEWDENAVDENHRNALGIRRDSETRMAYATALHLIGKQHEAMQQALLASELTPERLSLLKDAADYAQSAGHFSKVTEIVEILRRRSNASQQKAMEVDEMDEAAYGAIEILKATNVSEDVVAACNSIAFRVLRQNKVPYVSTRTETDAQDKYIMYYIDIAAEEEKVEELDRALGVALFDEVPEFNPDAYWVGYRKAAIAS